MRVDIWSDVVCPWCAIGIARFDRAVERAELTVDVYLHPFQLDPHAPIPGVPARARYEQKFGGDAAEMLARVTEEAAREGIAFDFDRALTANTFDAHRAIAFARASGKDRELEGGLFTAYFCDGRDISDRGVLADCGAAVGLERVDLAAFLAGDGGVEEVTHALDRAVEMGINSVPTFIFEDEFRVPGAVDTVTFERILAQMRAVS